jgi:hypothetical protein
MSWWWYSSTLTIQKQFRIFSITHLIFLYYEPEIQVEWKWGNEIEEASCCSQDWECQVPPCDRRYLIIPCVHPSSEKARTMAAIKSLFWTYQAFELGSSLLCLSQASASLEKNVFIQGQFLKKQICQKNWSRNNPWAKDLCWPSILSKYPMHARQGLGKWRKMSGAFDEQTDRQRQTDICLSISQNCDSPSLKHVWRHNPRRTDRQRGPFLLHSSYPAKLSVILRLIWKEQTSHTPSVSFSLTYPQESWADTTVRWCWHIHTASADRWSVSCGSSRQGCACDRRKQWNRVGDMQGPRICRRKSNHVQSPRGARLRSHRKSDQGKIRNFFSQSTYFVLLFLWKWFQYKKTVHVSLWGHTQPLTHIRKLFSLTKSPQSGGRSREKRGMRCQMPISWWRRLISETCDPSTNSHFRFVAVPLCTNTSMARYVFVCFCAWNHR